MEETISFLGGVVKVWDINGNIILSQVHAKYCQCRKGEFWTGNGKKTECRAKFKIIEERKDRKTILCRKSRFKKIILRSTKEELSRPDEMGLKFVKII